MGTCNSISKVALLLLAVCFWLATGGLIYLSVELLAVLSPVDGILEDASYLALSCWAVIASTFFLFILGVLSFFAACCNSKCLQIVYFVILLLGLAGVTTSATFCLIYREQIQDDIYSSLDDALQRYTIDSDISLSASSEIDHGVDFMQKNYQCCGVEKYTDWQSTPWGMMHWYHVPVSCCKEKMQDCSGSTQMEDLYKINQSGCKEPLYGHIMDYLILMIIVTLATALTQILGMTCSCIRLCAMEPDEVPFTPMQNEPEVAVTTSSRQVQTDWTQGVRGQEVQEAPRPI